MIENNVMVKYKNVNYLTIFVQIRDSYVKKTLLDLGASVNLLPYSIY